jgi:hypothetical protein
MSRLVVAVLQQLAIRELAIRADVASWLAEG